MSVSMAYDYTCRFCSAVSSVFVSLDLALRATRAASQGDHEEAKKIVPAEWTSGEIIGTAVSSFCIVSLLVWNLS